MPAHDQHGPVYTRSDYKKAYEEAVRALAAVKRENADVEKVADLTDELTAIMERWTGYYRIGYSPKTKQYWARWKWTAGAYEDHYTFASGANVREALWALIDNVSDVENGKRRASKDKGYKAVQKDGA